MTIAEILLLDYDNEIANTRLTLERVPEDQPEWAPHEKSMKLGKLAMHCATIPMFGYYILEDDAMDMADSKRPHVPLTFTTRADALAALADSSTKCRTALVSAARRLPPPARHPRPRALWAVSRRAVVAKVEQSY